MYNYIYPLSIAVFGAIFILVGSHQRKKCRCFNRKSVMVDAVITRIDHTKRRHRNHGTVYIVYAEYTIDGKTVEGRHFENLRGGKVKCRVGDRVQVIVPPERPEIFALRNIDVNKEKKTYTKMVAFGVIVIAAALSVPVISTITLIHNS